VELETQSDVLTGFACEAGQGFLFSRPVCGDEVERMLGEAACLEDSSAS
jgi:EAL domain-containing protein (putative c-di-GMP-specific phosphodiesterase class I)